MVLLSVILKANPRITRLRPRLVKRFLDLRAQFSQLKGLIGFRGVQDIREEIGRRYVKILRALVELNDKEIEQVQKYVEEIGYQALLHRLRGAEELYLLARQSFRAYPLAYLRHLSRLVRFTQSETRKKRVYLARKALHGFRIPQGRPQNLIGRDKEGQPFATQEGQYIRAYGEWYEVIQLPRYRDGHYHCRLLCYDREEVFTGQMLNDFMREEIEEVSVRHPFEVYLREEKELRRLFELRQEELAT